MNKPLITILTRTKSQAAMQKLEQDYFNNLLPFWKRIPMDKKELILSFK